MDQEIDPCQRLAVAIKNLYEAFSGYHLDQNVLKDSLWPRRSEFLKKPLREFTKEDLPEWALEDRDEGALERSEKEWKHFLPKSLELFALGELDYGPGEVWYQLSFTWPWWRWPNNEQEAVRGYLRALWPCTLARYGRDTPPVEDVLLGAVMVHEDIEPYLAEWRSATSGTALCHLADLFSGSTETIQKTKRLGGRWDDYPEQSKRVLEWLLEPETFAQLDEGFFRYQDEPIAEKISVAHDELDWLRQKWRSRWDPYIPHG